jgi:hypothetical protein
VPAAASSGIPALGPVVTPETAIDPEILEKARRPVAVGRFHIALQKGSSAYGPPVPAGPPRLQSNS